MITVTLKVLFYWTRILISVLGWVSMKVGSCLVYKQLRLGCSPFTLFWFIFLVLNLLRGRRFFGVAFKCERVILVVSAIRTIRLDERLWSFCLTFWLLLLVFSLRE